MFLKKIADYSDEDTAKLIKNLATLFGEHSMTLSLAESCSGGLIAKLITDLPGCSSFFLEGVVSYSNAAKMRLLAVKAELLDKYGAVSEECAKAMSSGIRKASGSDIAVAVTGIAGPDGGSPDKPVGTVFVSLAAKDGCWVKRFSFSGDRDAVRRLTALVAVEWLCFYMDQKSLRGRS